MRKITLLIIISLFLIAGCNKDNFDKVNYEDIVCEKPYLKIGDGCCLDKNSNSICDRNEKPPEKEVIEVEDEITVTEEDVEEPRNKGIVEIYRYSFEPNTIEITAGETITWINKDDRKHTVSGKDWGFRSTVLEENKEFTYTFEEPGTYNYVDGVFGLKGKVIVS